jgi:V-type H+-transporting ATPase subunit a
MKISVIFGVWQMMFGICIKGMNALYFKRPLDFIFEFIPQILFMGLLFFYMTIMIFIKWGTDWETSLTGPPSIITTLMNIFLGGGSVEGKPLFAGQEAFNFTALIIALICVPLILFPKPIITFCSQDKDDEHYEGFGEFFIHQLIETIEFVLGAISNTASYLRLWALSLAHAQLAKVFFDKCLLPFIQSGSIIGIIVGFFLFANVTFGVLMCMDLLECFLHTLRLHWVEFQNKFYKGDGYKFNPFTFRVLFPEE